MARRHGACRPVRSQLQGPQGQLRVVARTRRSRAPEIVVWCRVRNRRSRRSAWSRRCALQRCAPPVAGVPVVALGTTPANSLPLDTTGYQFVW